MTDKHKTGTIAAIVLISLFLVALVLLTSRKQTDKVCKKGFASLARLDIKKDGRIVVKLVKDGEYWTINDLLPVRKEAIRKVGYIIDNMKIIGKVSDHELFDIRDQLLNVSPEIILWSNNEVVNSFFIGGQPLDSSGNYFIPSDDLIVYLVAVKDIRDDISKYFSSDPDYWREKYFLRHISGKTRFITVKYPGEHKFMRAFDQQDKKLADSVMDMKVIDNAGIIDSLLILYKTNKYVCKIDFLDKDEIPRRVLICFHNNGNYLALFADDGDNRLALILNPADMEIIKSLLSRKK